MPKQAVQPAGHHATPGYMHAWRASGEFLFISGQVPLDADRNIVGPGDFETQAHQVFHNIERVLKDVGADFSNIVRYTGFLTSHAFVDDYRRIRLMYVTEPFPANTVVVVTGLANPHYLLEVEVIACL